MSQKSVQIRECLHICKRAREHHRVGLVAVSSIVIEAPMPMRSAAVGCSSPVRSLRLVASLTAGQVSAAVVHALLQLQAADEATQRQIEAESKRKQKVRLATDA